MAKATNQEATETKQVQKFSKEAFVNAADSKDRIVLQALLDDKTSYTKEEVKDLLKEWKEKEINPKKEDEK